MFSSCLSQNLLSLSSGQIQSILGCVRSISRQYRSASSPCSENDSKRDLDPSTLRPSNKIQLLDALKIDLLIASQQITALNPLRHIGDARDSLRISINDSDIAGGVELINDLLDAIKPSKRFGDSYVSASSFFENKHGFHESFLTSAKANPSPSFGNASYRGFLNTTQWLAKCNISPLIIQARNFHSKRVKKSSGVGNRNNEMASSVLQKLRQSFEERLIGQKPDFQKQSKLQNLLDDNKHSPDVQQHLKVAFAEGYRAKDGAQDSSSKRSKLIKVFWYGFLLYLIYQIFSGSLSIGIGDVKINPLKGDRYEINPEDVNVFFDDVKGVDEAKQELQEVVDFLKNPTKFRSLGAKLPKGVLLVGPPGIGKTLLARAVAGEAGVPFFHASGSEFDEVFVGTGAKRIRQLFESAKARAPCVIFIDEIDTVGAKRTTSQIHPYANQTINQLLSEMDGFDKNNGVIVLGATNRRDYLDPALLRPGRFDVEVRVFVPDLKGRRDIFKHYLSAVVVGDDIEIESLARGTAGCTGADIENIVNQAALKAAIDNDDGVFMRHMDFAKDKILMGPAKKTKIMDEETNLLTAYHEAGHTLVAIYTKDATPLHKVTIVPRGMSLGHTSFVPEKDQYNITRAQLLAQMDVAMGGRVAEELIFGPDKVTTGAGSDFDTATKIATAMVKTYGMSEKVGVRVFSQESMDSGLGLVRVNELSPAITEVVDNEIKRLLMESYERAKAILKAHAGEHRKLALALMKYEILDKNEIMQILEGKTIG